MLRITLESYGPPSLYIWKYLLQKFTTLRQHAPTSPTERWLGCMNGTAEIQKTPRKKPWSTHLGTYLAMTLLMKSLRCSDKTKCAHDVVRDPLSINYVICDHNHSWWEKGRCDVISHLLYPCILNLTNYTENRPMWQLFLKRNLLTAWVGSALGTDTIYHRDPLTPCFAGSVLETSHIFEVFTHSKNQDGADSSNSSSLKTRKNLSL